MPYFTPFVSWSATRLYFRRNLLIGMSAPDRSSAPRPPPAGQPTAPGAAARLVAGDRLGRFASHDGTDFLVLELLTGETLHQRLARGPLAVEGVVPVAIGVAEALSAAHDAGVVHGDLKPSNVMLTADGPKLLDFGIAIIQTSDVETKAASVAGLVGTLPYLSPEQIQGHTATPQSDQFAYGAILYEMLAGRRLFDQGQPAATMAAILGDRPQALDGLAGKIPKPLEWTLDRCLDQDPRQRYAATADLVRDLRAVRDHLAQGANLPECLASVRKVYRQEISDTLLLRALTFFDDAEREAALVGEGPN
ncbi:MAG: serine/threonine-protein kinase, partial [Acidobacteriota bacterium]